MKGTLILCDQSGPIQLFVACILDVFKVLMGRCECTARLQVLSQSQSFIRKVENPSALALILGVDKHLTMYS